MWRCLAQYCVVECLKNILHVWWPISGRRGWAGDGNGNHNDRHIIHDRDDHRMTRRAPVVVTTVLTAYHDTIYAALGENRFLPNRSIYWANLVTHRYSAPLPTYSAQTTCHSTNNCKARVKVTIHQQRFYLWISVSIRDV